MCNILSVKVNIIYAWCTNDTCVMLACKKLRNEKISTTKKAESFLHFVAVFPIWPNNKTKADPAPFAVYAGGRKRSALAGKGEGGDEKARIIAAAKSVFWRYANQVFSTGQVFVDV